MTTLNQFVVKLQTAFPTYHFRTDGLGTGYANARVYVEHQGIQLGGISLRPIVSGSKHYEVFGWRHYKPDDYPFELCDRFFYLFPGWLRTGRMPEIDFVSLVVQAKQNILRRNAAQMDWRAANPKYKLFEVDSVGVCRPVIKKRKALCKKWMGEFRKLCALEDTHTVIALSTYVR